jgi:hypothetical protein
LEKEVFMRFHLVYFTDWQTGNETSHTFWELLDTELLEEFGFLEWGSAMGVFDIENKVKPEWTIISSEASEDFIFIWTYYLPIV